MKLKIEISEFENQIGKFVKRFELVEENKCTTDEELKEQQSTFIQLCKEVEAFLNTQILPKENKYSELFKEASIAFKETGNNVTPFELRGKALVNKAKEKKIDIQRIYKLTSISDIMLNNISNEELVARKTFTIRDKKSLILEKLYQLNDGWYYSIKSICEGNNLNSKRRDEYIGLAKNLEKEKLIEIFNSTSEDVSARLTIQGQEFVEEIISNRLKIKRAVSQIKKEYNNSNLNELKTNLEELISKNEIKKVLEKLDLILKNDGDVRNDLIMLLGRFESIESKRRNGLLSESEYLLSENKIRFDVLSIIESLKTANDLR